MCPPSSRSAWAQGKCVIENIPNISDISVLFKILRSLGAQVRVLDRTTVEIDTTYIGEHQLSRIKREFFVFFHENIGGIFSKAGLKTVRVLDRTTVEIDTTYIGEPVVPYELARYMRA